GAQTRPGTRTLLGSHLAYLLVNESLSYAAIRGPLKRWRNRHPVATPRMAPPLERALRQMFVPAVDDGTGERSADQGALGYGAEWRGVDLVHLYRGGRA